MTQNVILEQNLTRLKKTNPDLAAQLVSIEPSGRFSVTASRRGPATLSQKISGDVSKSLHSSYDPVGEAVRYIESCEVQNGGHFIVLGLGLGYHILELVRQIPGACRILVFERDLEIVRLAMEQVDLRILLDHPGVTFHTEVVPGDCGQLLEDEKIELVLGGYTWIAVPSLINANKQYYDSLALELQRVFQETQVDLKTRSAFSKPFYKNIIENWPHILRTPGVNSLQNLFAKTPAVIISSGPSLDKNIALLKSTGGKVLKIAVDTALTPLLRNGVEPDFVVAIDPDPSTIKAFDMENPTPGLWLVFDPCVPKAIPDRFVNKIMLDSDVYLSQWIAGHYEEKGSLGKSFSVAHTAYLFARHLGCNPIIFVGQDFSFNKTRLHCSGSRYAEAQVDRIGAIQTMNMIQSQNLSNYAGSLGITEDLFGKAAATTTALDTYKNCFAETIQPSHQVFNATEGGIPIPGVRNISLREALTLHCIASVASWRQELSGHLQPAARPQSIIAALREESAFLRKLKSQLEKLQDNRLPSEQLLQEEREIFVVEMKKMYKLLTDRPDSLLLLQGYSYAEFLQWKLDNDTLLKKAAQPEDKELIQAKFDRDKNFLEVLIESTGFLSRAFDRMADNAVGE